MIDFLAGWVAFACWMMGLFFFRSWKKTKDRFFGFFGVAFWMLTGERFVLAVIDATQDSAFYIYFVRMTAFLLIIAAIVDKNWPRSEASRREG